MAQQWYCRSEEQEVGPISARELRRLARIGKITPQTEVRLEATGAWVVAGLVPGLFSNGEKKKSPEASARQNPAAAALAMLAESASEAESPTLEDFDPAALVAAHESQAAVEPAQEKLELIDAEDRTPDEEPLIDITAAPPIQLAEPPVASSSAILSNRPKRLNRQINILCVAAGFLSLVAVAVSSFPVLPIIVALLAVILAVRALGKVDRRIGLSYGLPAVSAVLSLFAVCIGIYATFFLNGGIAGWRDAIHVSQNAGNDPQENEKPNRSAADARWHSAKAGPAIAGDIQLELTSAAIGPLDLGDETASQRLRDELGNDAIYITLKIKNGSENRKLDYSSWSGSGGGAVMPSLVDNFDNRYQRVRVRGSVPGLAQVSKTSIYPGKSVEDTLIFQAPVAGASELRLALPLLALRGKGDLRIEIPRSMIDERAAEPPKLAVNEPPKVEPEQEQTLPKFPGGANQEPVEEPAEPMDEEPAFGGGRVTLPAPGSALGKQPAPRRTDPEEIVDDGKFVESPFGGKREEKPPGRQPAQQPPQVQPAEGERVIDPVLPRHGQGIANPALVSEEDLAPPRDDPFKPLEN